MTKQMKGPFRVIRSFDTLRMVGLWVLLALGVGMSHLALAGVLPEDRADLLFHRFEGGGVTVEGPSVLVRKKLGDNFSVSANYYTDMVTSASIDVVVSGASQYKEERTQYSVGVDYLRDKTTYSVNFLSSDENDYLSKNYSFDISQDVFGDLTTISFGYTKGDDMVMRRSPTGSGIDPTFGKQPVDRRSYRVGLSQILTKNLITSVNLEVIEDEGYLHNPYRSFRYVDPSNPMRFQLQTEIYPHTRTSDAVALNARYYLPYRAAIHGGYRFFTDTWGIGANTFELGYTQPRGAWTFDSSVRYYAQTHADFYSDLFPRADFQNFEARDKELATFNSTGVHLGATYELPTSRWPWLKRGTLNLFYDRIQFRYEDYRDARVTGVTPGTEPLYGYGANVIQAFVSVFF